MHPTHRLSIPFDKLTMPNEQAMICHAHAFTTTGSACG
jgi:hypothetical protein